MYKQKFYYAISINEELKVSVIKRRNNSYSLIYKEEGDDIQKIIVKFSDNKFFYYIENLIDKEIIYVQIDQVIKKITSQEEKDILLYFWKHFEEIVTNIKLLESYRFVIGLERKELDMIKSIPKSDLHNHIALGGSREILYELTGIKLPKLNTKLRSVPEMNQWFDTNDISIKGSRFFPMRLQASFMQAQQDNVKVFAPNISLCARKNFESYDHMMNFIKNMVDNYSENMSIYPELCLDRNKFKLDDTDDILYLLKSGLFYSIDIVGDEKLGVDPFVKIYKIAGELGIIRKAHIGEFGDALDIKDAIEKLDLDTIQHGLSAINDNEVLNQIKEKNISLTICPTSNIMLSRVKSYKNHPIKSFWRNGIGLTIGSDDILIFDSTLSQEYLSLYEKKCLTEFELNNIRLFGLRFYN